MAGIPYFLEEGAGVCGVYLEGPKTITVEAGPTANDPQFRAPKEEDVRGKEPELPELRNLPDDMFIEREPGPGPELKPAPDGLFELKQPDPKYRL